MRYVNSYTISFCVNLRSFHKFFLQKRITLQQCHDKFLQLIMHKQYNSKQRKYITKEGIFLINCFKEKSRHDTLFLKNQTSNVKLD